MIFNSDVLKLIKLIFISQVLLSCATSPTGRKQLILFSRSKAGEMGAQTFQEIKNKMQIERDHRINQYVQCVSRAITYAAQGDLPETNWEAVVFRDPSANAFALPGGKIGVHTGLLKVAINQNQLAAVLGHEVGHVIARHGTERVSQGIATQVAMMSVSEIMGDKKNKGIVMAGLGVGAQLGILLPFSRSHETEADLIGLNLMAEAGFDPNESVSLWENMKKKSGGAPPEWLSTHPSSDRRISQLRQNIPVVWPIYKDAQSKGFKPSCSI